MTQLFTPVQPMKPYDLTEQDVRLVAGNPIYRFQPKIDGIRLLVHRPAHWPRAAGAVVQTASGLQIPNRFTRTHLTAMLDLIELALLDEFPVEFVEKVIRCGIDGEVTVPGSFQDTSSGLMSQRGEPDFTFFMFDVALPFTTFQTRLNVLETLSRTLGKYAGSSRLYVLPALHTAAEAMAENVALARPGFKTDGIIVRNTLAPYKFGRSTKLDGGLGRFKPLAHAEGKIVGFVEGEQNLNAAKTDRYGKTKRSTSQHGKVPNGSLGAFEIISPAFANPFTIGTGEGLTHSLRRLIWENKGDYLAKTVTFSYLLEGSTPDAPRQPIWRGFRDATDTTDY